MMATLMVILLILVQGINLAASKDDLPLRACESRVEYILHTNCSSAFRESVPSCGPGKRLINECVTEASEACGSCQEGFYQPYHNHCPTCHRCTVCKDHQRTVDPCTDESDTVCEDLDTATEASPKSAYPSGPTAADPAQTISPSSEVSSEPAYITQIPSVTTVVGATSGNVPVGELSIIVNPTAAATDEVGGGDGDISPHDDPNENIQVVVALAVAVAILSTLLVIATIGCCYYRSKFIALTRRKINLEGSAERGRCGQRYSTIPMEELIRGATEDIGTPPSTPEPRAANGIGEHAPPMQNPTDDPIYARVNKQGKAAKSGSVDPKSIHSEPQKASEGSGRNAACKLAGKVFKGRSGKTKKGREPGSAAEKGSLLVSSPGTPKTEIGRQHPTSPSGSTEPGLPGDVSDGALRKPPQLTAAPPSAASSASSTSATPSPPPPVSTPPRREAQRCPAPRELSSQPLPKVSPAAQSTTLPPQPSSGSLSSLSTPQTSDAPVSSKVLPPSTLPHPSRSSAPHPSSSPDLSLSVTPPSQPPTSSSIPSELTHLQSSPSSSSSSSTADGDRKDGDKEEAQTPLIQPDNTVREDFLDCIPYEVSLEDIEAIARKIGHKQKDINNIKHSYHYQSPKTIGFHILQDVFNDQGQELTYRRILVAIRECGQKMAGDKLIADFGIDLELER